MFLLGLFPLKARRAKCFDFILIRLRQLSLLQNANGPVLANCDRFLCVTWFITNCDGYWFMGWYRFLKIATLQPFSTLSTELPVSVSYDWRGAWNWPDPIDLMPTTQTSLFKKLPRCCFKPGHQRWPNIDQCWITHTYAFLLSASVRPCWQCHQTNNNEAFWFPQPLPHKGLKNFIDRWYS